MSTVSKSFTAVGAGNEFTINNGQSFTYSVSGTFVGTVELKRSVNGPDGPWVTILSTTGSASGTIPCEEKPAARYRFDCDAYTSGTIVTSLADVVTEAMKEYVNTDGTPVLQINEQGISTPQATITGTPTNDTDATTKGAVDTLLAARKWKQPVVCATTTSGTLSTAFANGQTVDGITLATGDRILIKDQGDENGGIYIVAASGAPTRASDADSAAELVDAFIPVTKGTVNADKVYKVTNDTITLESTTITFVSVALTSGAQTIAGAKTFSSAITASAGVSSADHLTMTNAAKGVVLKQGANGKCGTFVCNGTTPVTVNNTSIAITDTIVISLNTVGGTVGAVPAVKTITASTGFTVAGTASDTSTYNYAIISNAA